MTNQKQLKALEQRAAAVYRRANRRYLLARDMGAKSGLYFAYLREIYQSHTEIWNMAIFYKRASHQAINQAELLIDDMLRRSRALDEAINHQLLKQVELAVSIENDMAQLAGL